MNTFYFIDDNLKIAGFFQDGLQEIFDYDTSNMGNIYRGRIENIDYNLNAAFVDIGEEKNGYLQFQKGDKFYEKQELIVQVVQEKKNKGMTLKTEISLSHPYFVLFPFKKFKKFSRKLHPKKINKLIGVTRDILKESSVGILFRTEAASVPEEDLISLLISHLMIAESLKLEINRRPTPKKLYSNSKLSSYYKNGDPSLPWRINRKDVVGNIEAHHYEPDFSIRYHPHLWKDYLGLFQKEVLLNSGGKIIVEETEALTAIDVDTGGTDRIKTFKSLARTINQEASLEIMRQIKLRNLSGIIIIDFLKMEKGEREEFYLYFRKRQREEEINLRVHGFTKLGLLECSRPNMGRKLEDKRRR